MNIEDVRYSIEIEAPFGIWPDRKIGQQTKSLGRKTAGGLTAWSDG